MHLLSIISVFLISSGSASLTDIDFNHLSVLQTQEGEILPYVYFTLGAVVGGSVESTGNIKNLCAADITSIIVSSYHIYYYMMDYMES